VRAYRASNLEARDRLRPVVGGVCPEVTEPVDLERRTPHARAHDRRQLHRTSYMVRVGDDDILNAAERFDMAPIVVAERQGNDGDVAVRRLPEDAVEIHITAFVKVVPA
jgi:hypothetical protein